MSNNLKDSSDSNAPDIKPIEAPEGLDLHPKPNTSVRISKRAGVAIGVVVLGLLSAFAYGGYRRQIRAQAAAHDAGIPSAVGPATASANEVVKDTDARIHFIDYTAEVEQARSHGELRPNAFARFRRTFVDREPTLEIEDLGDSEALVNAYGRLEATAKALLKRGILPTEDGWGGWLGRYQTALRRAAMELEYSRTASDHDRVRDRSLGR